MSDIHDAAQTEPTPTPPERRTGVRGPVVVLLVLVAIIGGSFAGAQFVSSYLMDQRNLPDYAGVRPVEEAADTAIGMPYTDTASGAIDSAADFGDVPQDQFQQEPAHDTSGSNQVPAYYGTTFDDEPVAPSDWQEFGSTPAPTATTSPNPRPAAEFDQEQRRFQKQIQRLKSRVDQLEARLQQRASQRDQIIRAKGQQPARRSSDRFDNSFGDVRNLPAPAIQNPPTYDAPAYDRPEQPPSRATNADPRNLMPGAQSGFNVEDVFQGQQDFAPEPASSYGAAQAGPNTPPDQPNIADPDPGFRPSTSNFDRVRQPEQFQPARNIPPRTNDSIESTDNFNPRSSFDAPANQPPLRDESPATRAAPLDSDTAPAARPDDSVRPIDQFVPRPDSPALQSDDFEPGGDANLLKDPVPRPSPSRSDMNSPLEDLAPREIEPSDDFNLEPDFGSDEAAPLPPSSSDLGFNSNSRTVSPAETSGDLLLQEPIPQPNGFSRPPVGNGTRQPADSLGSILCQRFQTTKSRIAALSPKQNLTADEKEALQFLREELFVISEQVRSQKVLVRRRWTQAQQRHRNLASALASLQQNGVTAPAATKPIEDKIQSVLAEERQLEKLTVEMEASDVVTLAQLVSDTPVPINFENTTVQGVLDWFAQQGNLTFDVQTKLPEQPVTNQAFLVPTSPATGLTQILASVNLRQYVERDPAGRLKIVITDAPVSNGLNSDSWNPNARREEVRPPSDDGWLEGPGLKNPPPAREAKAEILLFGDVTKSGVFQFTGQPSIIDIVARAGGLSKNAGRGPASARVLRGGFGQTKVAWSGLVSTLQTSDFQMAHGDMVVIHIAEAGSAPRKRGEVSIISPDTRPLMVSLEPGKVKASQLLAKVGITTDNFRIVRTAPGADLVDPTDGDTVMIHGDILMVGPKAAQKTPPRIKSNEETQDRLGQDDFLPPEIAPETSTKELPPPAPPSDKPDSNDADGLLEPTPTEADTAPDRTSLEGNPPQNKPLAARIEKYLGAIARAETRIRRIQTQQNAPDTTILQKDLLRLQLGAAVNEQTELRTRLEADMRSFDRSFFDEDSPFHVANGSSTVRVDLKECSLKHAVSWFERKLDAIIVMPRNIDPQQMVSFNANSQSYRNALVQFLQRFDLVLRTYTASERRVFVAGRRQSKADQARLRKEHTACELTETALLAELRTLETAQQDSGNTAALALLIPQLNAQLEDPFSLASRLQNKHTLNGPAAADPAVAELSELKKSLKEILAAGDAISPEQYRKLLEIHVKVIRQQKTELALLIEPKLSNANR